MRTAELDYHLPAELIATEPATPRDASRLMVLRRDRDEVAHQRVRDLPSLLAGPNDLLVVNQSKVLPAAFQAVRAATGGKIGGLYLSGPEPGRWQVLLESGGSLRPGETVTLNEYSSLELLEPLGEGQWSARLDSPDDDLTLLDRIGSTPLPPYIRKARRDRQQPEVQPPDAVRYNTVYATDPGSVAAPTAGLHFTDQLLAALDATGVRRAAVALHVGLGTFAPVRTERVEDHPIHSEWLSVPAATINALRHAREQGGRIIVVGTTAVRALESLPDPLPRDNRPFTTNTSLFITPESARQPDGRSSRRDAFQFRFTDALMTNFHLPRSTLLALVAALPGVGIDRLLDCYRQAIAEEYRFYSYGDAMLIL